MAQGKTKNLGQIAAIWISSNAPENVQLIWYDTSERVHKVYEVATGEWVALNPQIVTNSTISDLRNIAQQSGLSVGKYFFLTDVGTLAVAITTTKIWYVDSFNNYVVNDLAASIQTYINSDNLLLDGSTGVWDNTTGKLVFSFTTISSGYSIQPENDYIVIRRKSDSNWSWIKTKLSNLISAVSGNSISWNSGFYFNFTTAINNIKNKAGGIIGYEQYNIDKNAINTSINNVSRGNQQILNTAKDYTDEKTSESALLDKQIGKPRQIYSNPPDVPGVGTTIDDIINIIFSWISALQNSNKIKVGSGFSVLGRSGNVNYSDTVRAAIEKLVYKINHLSKFDGIAMNENFDYQGKNSNPIAFGDSLDVLLEKLLYQITTLMDIKTIISQVINTPSLYLTKGFKVNMIDSQGNDNTRMGFRIIDNALLLSNKEKIMEIATALFRLVLGSKKIEFTENGIIPITGFDYNGKEGDIVSGDTLEMMIEKLIYKISNLGVSVWDSKFLDDDWYATVNVGDKIGEFDSSGKALYSATLEGALYLLGAWYSEVMEKRRAESIYNAYYTSGRGDGRAEHNVTIRVKCSEAGIRFSMNQFLRFDTYQADNDYLNSYDSNDDACLVIRDLPKSIWQRIGNEYGYVEPINTNIPIVAKWGNGLFAKGILYAIIVYPPGSSEYFYLKLFPYFTDAVKTAVEPGITWNDDATEIIPTGSNKKFVSNIEVNTTGAFGSGWMADAGFSEEMINVTIPEFNFILSC